QFDAGFLDIRVNAGHDDSQKQKARNHYRSPWRTPSREGGGVARTWPIHPRPDGTGFARALNVSWIYRQSTRHGVALIVRAAFFPAQQHDLGTGGGLFAERHFVFVGFKLLVDVLLAFEKFIGAEKVFEHLGSVVHWENQALRFDLLDDLLGVGAVQRVDA